MTNRTTDELREAIEDAIEFSLLAKPGTSDFGNLVNAIMALLPQPPALGGIVKALEAAIEMSDDITGQISKAQSDWEQGGDHKAFDELCGWTYNGLLASYHSQFEEALTTLRANLKQEGWRPTQAVQDVVAERQRQIEKEGWSPDHDDEHSDGALADAGACYAMTERAVAKVDDLFLSATNQSRLSNYPYEWPFDEEWWKPKDRRRNLIRAGALIVAEIERLDRATPPQSEKE